MTRSPRTSIRLRRALPTDVRFLFRLRNDPSVRKQFKNTKPVRYADHVRWLAQTLTRADRVLFIGVDGRDKPFGQLRFDRAGQRVDISISLATPARGKGLSVPFLLRGIATLRRKMPRRIWFRAHIKRTNPASRAVFLRAGFVRYAGNGSWIYLRKRT